MAILKVTNNGDKGSGSLREAIANAQSGDTIQFDSNLSGQAIELDSFITIRKSLTIDGGESPDLTISGGSKTGLFRLTQEYENLTIRDLTLADAYEEDIQGGAIWAIENSTIDIENSKFLNNVSDGAALHGQAGTNITVTNSTFDGNDGASISDKGYSTGAISLFAYGSLTVKDSEFTNNKGFGGGALHITSSDLTVENSTFIGNDSTSGANKGSVFVPGGGGAIYLDGASVTRDAKYSAPGQDLEAEAGGGTAKIAGSHFETIVLRGKVEQ